MVCVCVCVCTYERERECVCVCVRERERERERERDSFCKEHKRTRNSVTKISERQSRRQTESVYVSDSTCMHLTSSHVLVTLKPSCLCCFSPDINECDEVRGICEGGECQNTFGSYVCRCPEGYRQDEDQHRCVGM